MTANKLLLNGDKTEFLVLNARHRPQPNIDSIQIDHDIIHASKSAKNIGVWLDDTLFMGKQITTMCKSAFFHLHSIAKIKKYISLQHCEILLHAFVTAKLDYCYSLLCGLKKEQIRKLQYVQNSAARLLTGAYRQDHITPILRELYWLPISERINFKVLLLTFKSLHDLAPSYLQELKRPYNPTRTLRPAKKRLSVQPRCKLKTCGERAF